MFYLRVVVVALAFFALYGCESTPKIVSMDASNRTYSLTQKAIIAIPDCSGWSEKYMIFIQQSNYSKHSCFPEAVITNLPEGTVLKDVEVIKKLSLGYGYLWRVKTRIEGYEEYGLIEVPACSLWHPESWIDCNAIRATPPKLKFNSEYISEKEDGQAQ